MFEKIARLLGFKKIPDDDFVVRTILVIDDDEGDLLLIRRTVEKMGHRVLTAGNGKIGLEMARTKEPDLILSDCRMPEMDGVEMCRRLKEDPRTKDIPLVFLTGVETPSTVVQCFDMGVDNYICKPINPKLLTNQIRAIFSEHFTS